MFTMLKETDGCYCIKDAKQTTIARVIGLNEHAPHHTRHTAVMVIEFLNHPLRGMRGFDCHVIKQNPLFPAADDEALEEFVEIKGPDDLPMAYVSDYGQGVALCNLLNRVIH